MGSLHLVLAFRHSRVSCCCGCCVALACAGLSRRSLLSKRILADEPRGAHARRTSGLLQCVCDRSL
eukprot:962427-Pelagomonas_calceolata.AAC.2